MLPQDAGSSLEKLILERSSVSVQLFSPHRPAVDVAEVFLWLMAVGTIVCASYWSAWSAREASIEQDKPLKDAPDEHTKAIGGSGVVEVNMISAILFVVIASCFLVIFYKVMSYWFIEVLVILFCLGGIEVWIIPFLVIMEFPEFGFLSPEKYLVLTMSFYGIVGFIIE